MEERPRSGDILVGGDVSIDYILGRVRRQRRLSLGERISIWVSDVTSSIYFVFSLILLYLVWIVGNVILYRLGRAFDQPWEFPVLLFISNAVQLLVPFIILISQRRQEEKLNDIIDKILFLMEQNDKDTRVIKDELRAELGGILAKLEQLALHHQALSNKIVGIVGK